MSIKINNFIICPIESFVQLALSIDLDPVQTIKLADMLYSTSCNNTESLRIKEGYLRDYDRYKNIKVIFPPGF